MLKNIMKNVQPAIGLTLGSVGSGMITKFIPVGDDKIKNGVVMLGGLLLMGSGKGQGKMLGHVGAGMVAGAGARLAAGFDLGDVNGIGDPEIDFDIDEVMQGPGESSPVSGAEGSDNDIAM